MMWTIKGGGDRWAAMAEGRFTADDDTSSAVADLAGSPVQITPTGAGVPADHPAWHYAAAMHVIPGPHTITGQVPTLPTSDAGDAGEGTVY